MSTFKNLLTRKLAYYWSPPTLDGYGNTVWGDPTEIECMYTFGSISSSELNDTPSLTDKSTSKVLVYDLTIVADGRIALFAPDIEFSSKVLKTSTSYLLSDNSKTITEAWLE